MPVHWLTHEMGAFANYQFSLFSLNKFYRKLYVQKVYPSMYIFEFWQNYVIVWGCLLSVQPYVAVVLYFFEIKRTIQFKWAFAIFMQTYYVIMETHSRIFKYNSGYCKRWFFNSIRVSRVETSEPDSNPRTKPSKNSINPRVILSLKTTFNVCCDANPLSNRSTQQSYNFQAANERNTTYFVFICGNMTTKLFQLILLLITKLNY